MDTKSVKQWIRLFSVSFFFMLLPACASNQSITSAVPLEIPADIAGLVHGIRYNTPEEYALLDRLGADWLLRTFSWSSVEPVQNQWDFDSYDIYVDTAKAAGKKIIGVLGYDVPWIHEDGRRHNYIPPEKTDFFLEYIRRTAAHFRGRVDAWCIWNEPNSDFWRGSRDEFLNLAGRSAAALREEDTDVVLLGGAFNRGVFGLPRAYVRGLFESGAMENADAVAFHPYEINPARSLKLYGSFRSLVSEYGFADRIWVTEVGYPTGGLYPTKVNEKKFPEYVVKTFVNLAAAGASKILWYQLYDPPLRSKNNSEHFFGLMRSQDDYTSKGAEAFRLCALHLAGTLYRPDLPLREERLPQSLRAFYFEKPDGAGAALVLWKEGSGARIRLQFPDAGNAGGFAVHDPVTGNSVQADAGTIITVGATPVFVSWQGKRLPLLSRGS